MTEKFAVIMAAGSGMGAAVARKLAEDGYKITVLLSKACHSSKALSRKF